MRRWGLIGAWVVVVALSTAMTWQIVSAADDRVSEFSGPPLNVGAPPESQTTVISAPTTTLPPSTTPTSGATTPTSSQPNNPDPSPEAVVIPTEGGTVTILVTPGSVTYSTAVPRPGFSVEVDDAGPPKVRVEFESLEISAKVEVRAEWRDGSLDVEIDVDD